MFGPRKLLALSRTERRNRSKLSVKLAIYSEPRWCSTHSIISRKPLQQSIRCVTAKVTRSFRWTIAWLSSRLKTWSSKSRSKRLSASFSWQWSRMRLSTTSLTVSMKLKDRLWAAFSEATFLCRKVSSILSSKTAKTFETTWKCRKTLKIGKLMRQQNTLWRPLKSQKKNDSP